MCQTKKYRFDPPFYVNMSVFSINISCRSKMTAYICTKHYKTQVSLLITQAELNVIQVPLQED